MNESRLASPGCSCSDVLVHSIYMRGNMDCASSGHRKDGKDDESKYGSIPQVDPICLGRAGVRAGHPEACTGTLRSR
jgi:hypothetical protein